MLLGLCGVNPTISPGNIQTQPARGGFLGGLNVFFFLGNGFREKLMSGYVFIATQIEFLLCRIDLRLTERKTRPRFPDL